MKKSKGMYPRYWLLLLFSLLVIYLFFYGVDGMKYLIA